MLSSLHTNRVKKALCLWLLFFLQFLYYISMQIHFTCRQLIWHWFIARLSINLGSVYEMIQQNKLPNPISLHWIMLGDLCYGSSTGFVSIDVVGHRNHAGRMAPVEYSHPIVQHNVLHT